MQRIHSSSCKISLFAFLIFITKLAFRLDFRLNTESIRILVYMFDEVNRSEIHVMRSDGIFRTENQYTLTSKSRDEWRTERERVRVREREREIDVRLLLISIPFHLAHFDGVSLIYENTLKISAHFISVLKAHISTVKIKFNTQF